MPQTTKGDQGHYVLVGHDNPLHQYPARVVPLVEERDGTLREVRLKTPGNPEYKRIHMDKQAAGKSGYVVYHERKPWMDRFVCHEDCLFAFSETEVEAYKAREEKQYLEKVLAGTELTVKAPFVALALAQDIGKEKWVLRAAAQCVKTVGQKHPDADQGFFERWYRVIRTGSEQLLPLELFKKK
jgi:hypothetical protein